MPKAYQHPGPPGPFAKYAGNPILSRSATGWESHALYNPAAWTDGQQVLLLYRAEGPCSFANRPFTSRIGLATSRNGFDFVRHEQPVLEPTEPYELPGGCEDPRIVRIGELFYLTYTAYDGQIARLALATSPDLLHWTKHGLLFSDAQWEAYFPTRSFPHTPRGWSKSGAILPEPVQGRYWMFFGDTNIWLASSPDLLTWTIEPEAVLTPRPGIFDSGLVEPGPPPLLLSDGIWLGYNSANTELRYAFGAALLDRNDPHRVLQRSSTPLLEPTLLAEREGQVAEVVFAEGLVFFQGQWLLYYGMADSRIGVAIASPATS